MGRPRRVEPSADPGVTLGQLVQSLRATQGMSRGELAVASGVSVNTVMKLEQGKVSDPGIFRVNALARALGSRINELVDTALDRHTSGARMTTGVISIGYEGWDVEGFIRELTARGVSTLIDVRLTPLSRKKGFSKNKLRDALEDAGMKYRHERVLGNPKDNRDAFRADDPSAVDRYEAILQEDASQASLQMIGGLAKSEVVAVLCFERDHADCHRRLVIEALGPVAVELA